MEVALVDTVSRLSLTNVDFSDHLVSLLEHNCLGPLQFLESGAQGVSLSQVWPSAACRGPSQISPGQTLGRGFLVGKGRLNQMGCGL